MVVSNEMQTLDFQSRWELILFGAFSLLLFDFSVDLIQAQNDSTYFYKCVWFYFPLSVISNCLLNLRCGYGSCRGSILVLRSSGCNSFFLFPLSETKPKVM